MRAARRFILFGSLCAALAAHAAEPLPDRRAVRPQAPLTSPAAPVPRETLLDIMTQLDALQNEVRQLRGQLEVQTHELERLKNRQRDAISDFDQRLQGIERRTPSAAAPAPGTGPTTVVTPPVSSSEPAPTTSSGEQQAYDAAFALMKQGQYERAAAGFRDFVVRHPKSALADNAQYWIGEAAYVTRNYKVARDEFEKVVNRYPNSPKVPDALLKVGFSLYEQGANDKAREVLNQVVSRYPNTPAAKSAEARLAKIGKETR